MTSVIALLIPVDSIMQTDHITGHISTAPVRDPSPRPASRSRLVWALAVYLPYASFIVSVAFGPAWLSRDFVPGVPMCLVLGPGVIVVGMLLALAQYLSSRGPAESARHYTHHLNRTR